MGTLVVTHVAAPAEREHPPVSLDDKYTNSSGRALMSGIHALVRLLLEQRRLDARRGLDTAAFISGYEGSHRRREASMAVCRTSHRRILVSRAGFRRQTADSAHDLARVVAARAAG